MAHVLIHHEVSVGGAGKWKLCFQYCTYMYDRGTSQRGYRFMYRKPNGHLQGARGQARIPDSAVMLRLMSKAAAAGWFGKVDELPPTVELPQVTESPTGE